MSDNSEKPGYSSPLRLLTIIAGSIFAVEALVMAILYFVEPFTSEWAKALLDSTLLIIILSPIFYYFLFRPLILHIHERKQAEIELNMTAAELKNTNDRLQESNLLLEHNSLELISAKERLNKENSFISAVLDTVGVFVLVFDRNGRVERINKACENIAGYSQDEAKGKFLWNMLMVPKELDKVKEIFEKLRTGILPGYYETHWTAKDGNRILIAWTNTILTDRGGQVEHIIGTGMDITERKKIEKMKDEFVSTVSHELRTPLTSIHGALGLVNSGVTGECPPQAKAMLDIAYKNSQRLITLINDILDIEKIESGRMEYRMKPLILATLIEQAIEANTAYGKQFGIRYEFLNTIPEAEVYADSHRLMQVMTNLLSNAAKFSRRDDTVEVSMEGLGETVRISIIDHGQGIPKEFQDKIFQKFAQADASDKREKGGTGLGLSICKNIIEKHSGYIGFTTNQATGTTFYFDLPALKKAESLAVHEPDLTEQLNVLVCEDDHDVATLLSIMLKHGGFNADIAYNAKQALQLLSEKHYAAMTLDLLLPDKNGLVLLRELRQQKETAAMPVIVVSAIAQKTHAMVDGGALSVIDWIDKPIDQERLVNAVKRSVGKITTRPRVLHVEDDPDIFQLVSTLLIDFADTFCAATLQEAIQSIKHESFDLILLDIGLPDHSGIELFKHLEGIYTPVVIFSSFDIGEDVLLKVSAALVKSRTSNEQLRDTIISALRHSRLVFGEENKVSCD